MKASHSDQMLELMLQGVWQVDAEGRTTYVNSRMAAMVGYSREELLPLRSLALVREDDRGWIAARNASRQQGVRDDYECHLVHKDGSWVSVTVESIPLIGEDGAFDGTLTLVTDITDRKRTEEALRETTSRHRRLVEAIPGILYSFEAGTGGTYYSPQVESVLGYTVDRLRQFPMLWHDSIHLDDVRAVDHVIARKSPGAVEVEYRIKDASGNWRWLLDRSVRVTRSDGTTTVEGLALDITSRKIAEDELRSLSRAVTQSPVSIVITNGAGDIEYVNPRFEQVTGYTRAEAIGQNPRILRSGTMPDETYVGLWKQISAGGEWRGEMRNRRKNGELFWESATISGLKDEEGRIHRYIAVKEEITERKRAEEVQSRLVHSLELARDEANRANALKSEFLASFSHEIRTPLNGVLGTADAVLAGHLEPAVREQLLIIQRSGSSLLRTINDVLEFSRLEAGRLDLFPVRTELPALLGEVVDLFRARANSHGLTLSLELESGHPRHVKVDDLRLRQVVQNLVGNAVKFTRQGSVRVRLAGGPAVDGLVPTRISVEDTGPGIDAEAVSRLFTAFSQTRPRTDSAEGTGLGLAVSKQFVELMDGKLTVDSTPGKGSTFTVELTLPVAEQTVTMVTAAAEVVAPVEPLKLLVVDDNEINLKVAVALLSRLGHEVVMARDGEQALAAVTAHQPDVVFMDRHMPVMDGLEATRRLRAAGDVRPIVAVTASVYADDQKLCREAGMNYFVSKPVSLASLQTALHEVAGGASGPAHTPAPDAAVLQRRVLVVDDDPHMRRMTVRLLRSEGFEVSDAGDVEEALILFERWAPNYLLVDQVLGGPEDGHHFAQRLCSRRSGLHVVVTSGRPLSEEESTSLISTGGQFLAKPYGRHELMDSMRRASGAGASGRAGAPLNRAETGGL